MRTLTVEKIGETEKAVQYRVTFWIVENPGHPVCWEGKEYYFGRWLPKRVVTPIDDTHIGIPKKFLEETIELLAKDIRSEKFAIMLSSNRRLYNGLNRRNQKNLENSLKISG